MAGVLLKSFLFMGIYHTASAESFVRTNDMVYRIEQSDRT